MHAHMVFCCPVDTAENRDAWAEALREAGLPEFEFPYRVPPCDEHEPRISHCENCHRPVWSTKRQRLKAGELKITGHTVSRLCFMCFPPILQFVMAQPLGLL